MLERFSIDLATAEALGDFVITNARRRFPNRPIAVMIVDIDDALVWGKRMNGCKPDSAEYALRKAITARRHNKVTHQDFADWTVKDILVAQPAHNRFMHWGGGAPIEYFNSHDPAFTIGGIGVSGLDEEEDNELVMLGVASLGLTFPK